MDTLDVQKAKLDEKLDNTDLPSAVATLMKDARLAKRRQLLLTISVAFDLLLSLGLAYGWHQNHSLAVKAESNRQAIIRDCESRNASRQSNRELWDYILAIPQDPSKPQRTPAEQEAVDKFAKKVADTFELKDCSKVLPEK